MKNLSFLTFLFTSLFLFSCGGNKAAEETAAIKKEVQQLDSISTEIEQVASEIEDKTKALDEAMSEMEKALEQ